MNVFITLDYELFFGENSGSVQKCIIKPTEQLLKIVDQYDIKLVIFVDVGYLVKLKELKKEFKNLEEDYHAITQQIQVLARNGHEIALHIHPHWEESEYDSGRWKFNTNQYKLADFTKEKAYEIVLKYANCLKQVSKTTPISYRAGGWSAQPFSHIKQALKDAGIRVDSTVYSNGIYKSKYQNFDFTNVPQYKTSYRFENDLTAEVENGYFSEYPISSHKISPLFFWQFAFEKFRKKPEHRAYGDGQAIKKSKKGVLRLMAKSSHSVVSVDGYKASFLHEAFKNYLDNTTSEDNFVIIGHPKAFTPYSLEKTREFIAQYAGNHNFTTFARQHSLF